MDFRLLGPLEIRSGSSYITIESNRHRRLLAALLVANGPVPVDRLVDAIWGETPPTTARQQAQSCIGSLRRKLTGADLEANISRRGTAYFLEISDNLVDARVFNKLCQDGSRFMQHGRIRRATFAFRSALQLWQGAALQDVGSETLLADAIQLEERRLQAMESLVGLEFSEGREALLVAELQKWSMMYPYNEALHCHLAEALAAAYRKAEALQSLQALRQRFRDELSIDVSLRVHEMEKRLLESGSPGRCRAASCWH